MGQQTPETYNQKVWLWGAGEAAGAGGAAQRPWGKALPQQAAQRGGGARSRADAVQLDRELPPPAQGQAVTEGGDTLGRVREEAEQWHCPRAAPRPSPAAQHQQTQGSDPRDRQLTNYGQGHLKTWPLQHQGCKGKRRQVGGHRDMLRPLDGNRRCWLRRGTGLRAGGHPGTRACRLHHTQCLWAEEAGGKRRKRRKSHVY